MGKTVVVSSHLLSEIEIIANRMIIIHKGEKIVEGNVAELLDPANTMVEINTTDDKTSLLKIQESKWAPFLENDKTNIRLHMNRADVPELVAYLHEMEVGILSVQPRHSLEDYFLSLTNNDTHVAAFTN